MRRVAVVTVALVLIAPLRPATAAAGPPRGVHIAYGADPRTTATVVWFTDGATDPGTVVRYGSSPETLGTIATGTAARAPGEYAGGQPLVHEVALTGLEPGTTVYYSAGSEAGWTAARAFRTAPAEDEPFRFTAVADHGTQPASVDTTTRVIESDPDLHLIAGDLSYAQPSVPTFPEWWRWDTWFAQLEPLAARVPVMPAVGNHECESVGCTGSFRARFALPGEELFYSFDYANVHFLVFLSDRSTLTQERRADALAFAETDLLAAAERKRAGEIDWIVVVQHHPLYGSQGSDPQGELLERRFNPVLIGAEERMLHLHHVDVLITGHNHHYERSKPMRYGVATTDERTTYSDPEGFVQVVTGGGGESTRGLIQPAPSWSAARAAVFEHVVFEVEGKTLRARAVATSDGSTIDSWSITRS